MSLFYHFVVKTYLAAHSFGQHFFNTKDSFFEVMTQSLADTVALPLKTRKISGN
jgi:hypothetical protein